MTVRLGDVTFSDWISLECEGGFTDTFIFDIDALNGLPPFRYRPLLQRLVAELDKKRPGASLWIRVTSPGEWYLMEVKRSMTRGLSIPYVVTSKDKTPDYRSFSFGPRLFSSSSSLHPPKVDDELSLFSCEELRCLQVLARIRKGTENEVASLTGLPETITYEVLQGLQKKKRVKFKLGEVIQKDRSKPKKMDPYPMWHPRRKGVSSALRSWGASEGVDFSGMKELYPHFIGTPHRTNSRKWLAWLRSAYPQVEIWTGWTEVQLPEMSVRPDALAWGRIQGFETVFAANTMANIARVTGGAMPDRALVEPLTYALAERGREIPAARFILNLHGLHRQARQIAGFFERYDIWLTPTLAQTPRPIGSFDIRRDDVDAWIRELGAYLPFTFPFNITGQPAASVPLYWDADGLPIGCQFAARYGEEGLLLRLCAQLEQARPWFHRRPPPAPTA